MFTKSFARNIPLSWTLHRVAGSETRFNRDASRELRLSDRPGSGFLGHEVRPGYLELRQKSDETFQVLWKVPAMGELRLAIYPNLPENCSPLADPLKVQTSGSYSERVSLNCKGGIVGHSIAISGLEATTTDVLVRLAARDGSVQTVRFDALGVILRS